MYYISFFLFFVFGVVCYYAFKNLIFKKKTSGTLNVDSSDMDGPYLFLELSEDLSKISNKKYVVLKVKNKNYIPQK